MPITEETTILSEVVAASLGGAISAGILYPLEVLKCRMQAVKDEDEEKEEGQHDNSNDDDDISSSTSNTEKKHDKEKKKSMIPFAMKLYKEQGISVFVRGIETSSFQSAVEKALYFFAYTILKDVHGIITGGNRELDGISNLIIGYMSDWAHLPITLPIDAWTTRIQTATTSNNNGDNNNNANAAQQTQAPLKILLSMLADRNCDFYKGLSAYYLLCFKPALQYTVYEQVKKTILLKKSRNRTNNKTQLSSSEAFLLGMFARTVATVLVFPFLRAKVLMQTSSNTTTTDSSSSSSNTTTNQKKNKLQHDDGKGTMAILLRQYQRSGMGGLYQGIGPELTRGIFSAALMLMIKERLAETVRNIFATPPQQQQSKNSQHSM